MMATILHVSNFLRYCIVQEFEVLDCKLKNSSMKIAEMISCSFKKFDFTLKINYSSIQEWILLALEFSSGEERFAPWQEAHLIFVVF